LAFLFKHCERLKNLALHFVCHEEITIEAYTYTRMAIKKRVGVGKDAASSEKWRTFSRPSDH
jgi:hypothetical protein